MSIGVQVFMSWHELPFGVGDLDKKLKRSRRTGAVCCPVRRCAHWIEPPARKKGTGQPCPDHGIYVHRSGTYRYANPADNVIVDREFFNRYILGNGFKYETHRLGMERSEDTLSFNVFRSLQRLGLLSEVAELCAGTRPSQEPTLYLWGLEIASDSVRPWDRLVEARERFESDLPVNRPLTEPDIALHVPGEMLILIEAKFTSGNTVYRRDKKTKLLDLTLDQLVNIYSDQSLKIMDFDRARRRDSGYSQLHRNMVFAEFMARRDAPTTRAYHVNLVREGFEEGACEGFLDVVRHEYHDRFEQITWEQVYQVIEKRRPRTDHLCRYLEQKTERFRPAFRVLRHLS